MKTVRVAAAVICDSVKEKHKIFAVARGYGEFKDLWEFPGGKIEEGETPEQALKREIEEELDMKIEVYDLIDTIEYDYPKFHISMDFFWCETITGKLVLKKAEAARWLSKDELDSVQWLSINLTLIEKIRIEMNANKEIISTEETEKLEEKIVLDSRSNKILKIHEGMTNIDFASAVDRLAQYVNIAEIVSTIEKGVEYVVQIPIQYQKQYETGEYFINQNKTTGIEWPTLMRKAETGQYRFVDNLPIEQEEFIRGNPFQDICNSYHNICMQQQMAQLSERIEETYQTVEMIERGQQDDRVAFIEAGRKEIMLALTLQDENDKNEQMRLGIHNLLLGREQIGKAMVRRIENFEPLPESRVVLFLNTLAHSNYQNKKDDEIEYIQECYEMYLQATKMIAGTYAYKGEMTAVEQTFEDGIAFLDGIDFGKLKSIELAHRGVDLDDMFYNHALWYMEIEKKQFLENGKLYDYVAVEVTGDRLLEVLSDGREISKEKVE
ncbi:mutator mutT protein [Anaerostipes hadrus ATCC 29173 = JCM 17467]|nr:(deoxy)nucleoside triphosphate pyrophosphohydrolase [Anaerostipes hadrus]EKY23510.1 mutator mutT protein [Anaerostipes hadrus ATCC 29173 = JCM 17467]BEG59702.1 hypothetical protein Ahadr17467_13320 [Anaerostipes hadrus ATCC 29173 = JCM 17467]